jgi:hypothetical protein
MAAQLSFSPLASIQVAQEDQNAQQNAQSKNSDSKQGSSAGRLYVACPPQAKQSEGNSSASHASAAVAVAVLNKQKSPSSQRHVGPNMGAAVEQSLMQALQALAIERELEEAQESSTTAVVTSSSSSSFVLSVGAVKLSQGGAVVDADIVITTPAPTHRDNTID